MSASHASKIPKTRGKNDRKCAIDRSRLLCLMKGAPIAFGEMADPKPVGRFASSGLGQGGRPPLFRMRGTTAGERLLKVNYAIVSAERWPSGRRRATRNRVSPKRASRVRIPLSPPAYGRLRRIFGWQTSSISYCLASRFSSASMKRRRSPSSTPSVSLVSSSVRRSFTIWYGCNT